MTVSSSTAKAGPYAGAGLPGPFTVPFRFLSASHLQVIRTSSSGLDTTLTLTADYTVSGMGAASGSVTLTAPLASGERLTIVRDVPFTQLADYVNNDAFPAESHEDALDLLTMQTQQLKERVDSALTLPSTVTGVDTDLPTPESNKLIGWNEAANALQNFDATTLATIVAFGTSRADTFTGNGTQTQFALTANPGALANLDVAIGGVTQVPDIDYTFSGTTLTFISGAPANGVRILARYFLALPQGVTDSAASTFLQAGTGAVTRTAQAKMRETVSVKDFGAVGDGVADDTAAMQKARNYAASASASGNIVEITFPAGRYNYTTSPNWAIDRLHMRADGEVWMIGSSGPAFLLDGGATGDGVYGIKIKGDFLIYAIGASSTHGVYARSISKSDLEFNIRGANPAFSGFYMEWGVSNTIRLLAGYNEGGWYPGRTPSTALTLQQRAPGEQSSYNTFINCELSGCPIGAYMDGALGNSFIGGAIQANTNYGLQLTTNALANKFIGTDFEVNTTADILCEGAENVFESVDSYTLAKFTPTSVSTRIIGGSFQNITIDTGAVRTALIGVVYNRFGSGLLVDGGTDTSFISCTDLGNASALPTTYKQYLSANGGMSGGYRFNYGTNIATRPWLLANDYSAFGTLSFLTSPTRTGAPATELGAIDSAGKLAMNSAVAANRNTAIPSGGAAGAGLMVSSTGNFGVFFGSGVPTLQAAKGSLYLRSDGSSTSTRMYVNTDGGTAWTAVTTAT